MQGDGKWSVHGSPCDAIFGYWRKLCDAAEDHVFGFVDEVMDRPGLVDMQFDTIGIAKGAKPSLRTIITIGVWAKRQVNGPTRRWAFTSRQIVSMHDMQAMHPGVDIFEDERKAIEHCKKFVEVGDSISAPPRPSECLAPEYKIVNDEVWLIAKRRVEEVQLLGPEEWNKLPECMFSALRSIIAGHAEAVGRLQQQLADAPEGSKQRERIERKIESVRQDARKHVVLCTKTNAEVRGKRAKEVVESLLRGNLRRGYQVVNVDAAAPSLGVGLGPHRFLRCLRVGGPLAICDDAEIVAAVAPLVDYTSAEDNSDGGSECGSGDSQRVLDDNAHDVHSDASEDGSGDESCDSEGCDGGLPKGVADVAVVFPNGSKISHYKDGRFEAVCWPHKDSQPKCRLTRTSKTGDPNDPENAQGRPLGLLAAWLMECDALEISSRDQHCDPSSLLRLTPDVRNKAREVLMSLPGGAKLASFERPRKLGEPAEPRGWA